MKIALVHDQLNEFGGAERVLLAMAEIWPQAPIYTAYCRRGSPAWERFKDRDIRTSFMQYLQGLASPLRFLAPTVWNSFDFSGYDVILGSSSWYITKGFANKGKAIEICYCHTPPRWLYGYATAKQNALVRAYGTIVGFFMRQYDYNAAQRVNYFIANSKETQTRIKKFYRRDAKVIYPPINAETRNKRQETRRYLLVVSRLAASKNIDQAILAANKLKLPLKIAGTGPDDVHLKAMAGPTVEFFGFVPDSALSSLYAGARAFLALASDEDFGMTPVEAMAAGTPVIAYEGGGYKETVIDGKTGVFFREPTVESLIKAISQFTNLPIKPIACITQAQKFSKSRFKKELISFVSDKCTNK